MSQYNPGMIQRIDRQQFYLSANQPTYAKPGVILEGILFRARFGLPMPQPSITMDRDTKRHKIDQCRANTERHHPSVSFRREFLRCQSVYFRNLSNHFNLICLLSSANSILACHMFASQRKDDLLP
jgi:hypothetical protein